MRSGLYPNHNTITLRRTVEPAVEVISLTDLKAYLKIDGTDEDTILGLLLAAATDLAEAYCKRAFITQTLKMTLDRFPYNAIEPMLSGVYHMPRGYGGAEYVELMRPPLLTVTSITTYNESNTSSVFSSSGYSLDIQAGVVYLNTGYTWPVSLRNKAAVEIIYTAGYGATAALVPDAIRVAIMMQAAAMYECRGTADLTSAARSLLDAFRTYNDIG